MADSACIKEIVNQAAVHAATLVMMAFRDTQTGPQPATLQNQWKTQRQRNGGLALEKPRFNCDMLDRYVGLLNFQLEVTNILETRTYEINDEERIPVKKVGRACCLWKLLHRRKKKNIKPQRDCSPC